MTSILCLPELSLVHEKVFLETFSLLNNSFAGFGQETCQGKIDWFGRAHESYAGADPGKVARTQVSPTSQWKIHIRGDSPL